LARLGSLCKNTLRASHDLPSLHSALEALQVLVLNGTPVTWEELCVVAAPLPHLEQLRLGACALTSLHLSDPQAIAGGYKKLSYLGLEENVLPWGEVEALGALPALTTLVLDKNILGPLHCIAPGSFATLQSLSLNGCEIDSWPCVDAIESFPVLESVQLSDNPVIVPRRG